MERQPTAKGLALSTQATGMPSRTDCLLPGVYVPILGGPAMWGDVSNMASVPSSYLDNSASHTNISQASSSTSRYSCSSLLSAFFIYSMMSTKRLSASAQKESREEGAEGGVEDFEHEMAMCTRIFWSRCPIGI